VSTVAAACTNEGNTPVSTCPSANLVGCCVYAALGEGACYYTGYADAANAPTTCTSGGGTWSTTMVP
jgi:hypothetical protein